MRLLTYTLYDFKRSIAGSSSFFFLVVMPVGFYLLFGAAQSYSDVSVGDGNVAAYVMIGMSVYGAVSGATSITNLATAESSQGWGRQLGLTPLTRSSFLISKAAVALGMAAVPVLAVNVTSLFTKASIPASQQIAAALLAIAGSLIFAFYGIAMALIFRSEKSVSLATGLLVFFAFFGTTFSPLSEQLLSYGRFTPMYGVTALARYPLTDGLTVLSSSDPWYLDEPLWYALVNIAAWLIFFVVLYLLLSRRRTAR